MESMDKNAIIACGSNVKPASGKAADPEGRLLEWRQRTADKSREVRMSLRRNQPHTIMRQTANGAVAVNTNGHYRKGSKVYVSVPFGPKKLNIGGFTSFGADNVDGASDILTAIENNALAGNLDAEIEALFSIPASQVQRMTDFKFIRRVARADASGKKVTGADRAKIDRLLKNAEYRTAYEDALAA